MIEETDGQQGEQTPDSAAARFARLQTSVRSNELFDEDNGSWTDEEMALLAEEARKLLDEYRP